MTADMGGTSFDVCLIDKEAPYVQSSIHNRHAIATRMVDIESIGAGGGSIARVERGNLTVGPDSAGAEPGPVCYSKGGIYPTVTDANAVLGYLNPKALLGGKMSIDVEAARRAVEDNIARLLGMEVEDAALGIVQVVDAHMADLLRFHALSRGHDPRDFSVFCFGGATGLHACGIAEQIGLSKTIVPLGGAATVFSAIGIARCDQKRFFSLSRTFALVAGNAELLVEAFDELMEVVRTQLAQEDIDPKRLGW
jgi:N-methylhydantoinase A